MAPAYGADAGYLLIAGKIGFPGLVATFDRPGAG
jgi:hypothetical protein